MIRFSSSQAFHLTLAAIAASAAALLLYSTPQGLGLSDDSIAYVAGARSLLQGNGYREIWLASAQPVTHLPPGFPVALASAGWLLGLDPLRATRLVNGLLFGGNSLFLGIIGWQMTRSRLAGVVLALLFAANASMLRLHADALSEPLYIAISLLAFLALARYVSLRYPRNVRAASGEDATGPRNIDRWLFLCGSLVGAAYLTRYAGLSLLATLLLAVLLLHDGWPEGLSRAAIVFGAALPWLAGWSLRNRLLGGSPTNRSLLWHPITSENLDIAKYNISEFLVPVETWRRSLIRAPGALEAVLLALASGLCLWLAYTVLRRLSVPGKSRPDALALVNGLYLVGYLTSLLAAMTLFDASTKFSLRILAPLYVSFFVLLVAGGTWIAERLAPAWRAAMLCFVILVLGLSASDAAGRVAELRRGGGGYASFKWYDSEVLALLRALPPATKVYTNEPGAVYLYAGRGAYVLPSTLDPVTAQARPGFEQGVGIMQEEIRAGVAVLALFEGAEILPEEATALTAGLFLAHKSAGDEIYAAAPR